jgi:hypothetical protein
MAVILAIFIPLVFVLSVLVAIIFSSFFPMFIVDGIAIGAACYLRNLWKERPIRLHCRSCKKIILSNTPWFCAVCKKANANVIEFPFVHKCEHCGAEPKAYRCQCKEFIFLTEDEDKINYAYRLGSPDDAPKPDERTTKRQQHQETKEDKENEVAVAELDEKLKTIRDRMKDPKVKTPFEKSQEKCEQEYVGIMGVSEYCRQKTMEAKELYKDDPERLRDALEAIEAIRVKYA